MNMKIITLTVADLGFSEGATTSEIIGTEHDADQHGNPAPFTGGRGRLLGLELCPPEVAPNYRLEYKDQPLDERLYVAMKPISSSDGEPRIFVLGHNADGLFLDAARARADDKWPSNNKFVFCMSDSEDKDIEKTNAEYTPEKTVGRYLSLQEDKGFEKAIAKHLSEELHTRRGLTAEAYTALCRKAWYECHTSPAFPFEILIDPLRSIESMLVNSTQEYVHWRVADMLEALREPSMEIRCEAVGSVKPDLSTGPDDRPPLPTDEPDVPETRRYLLAVFDVLGFSALLKNRGLSEITALYSRLITEAVTKDAMRTYTIVRFSETEEGSVLGVLPVRHAHFSDTIFLWVPLVQHFIAPFIARCADMVCEALKLGLPLRGALAVSPAVMHSRTGTFVGAPVVEAARLEQSQDWLGVSIGASMLAADVSREFDPHLILPYNVPFKKGKVRVSADLALDWPSRFRARYGTDPIDAVRAVDTSPSHHIYYDNAVKFAKFSAGPVFRSDGLRSPNLGELADAALDARRTGAAISRHHEFILKDLSRTGTVGDSVAQFVRFIAAGKDPPEISDVLPLGLQRYLRDLSLAAGGTAKFIKLVPCAVEAVCMRLCGTPLSQEADAILTELEQLGQDGKRVSSFLRDLATGEEPIVPRRLSKGMGPFLKQVLAWVNEGKIPSGLVRHVAEDCLKARLGYGALDHNALRALAAIEATNGSWPKLVVFLRGIAVGEDPVVPTDIPQPIQSDLVRISLSSRLAGVQPPRTLEIISVGFGDPATGIDLFSLLQELLAVKGDATEIPEEAERAIQHFEAAAPARAVIAQRLRSLITNDSPITSPDTLPVAIRLLIVQIQAVAKGEPIPLDPSLVGLAAIRTRHGGGAMGDCIVFSLHAMAMAHSEAKMLANYLWSIANGGPAGPAPLLMDTQMAATAEEVRCLADKEVGGIRLLMQQAVQPAG